MNRILEILGIDEYEQPAQKLSADLEVLLGTLCDYAVEKGLINDDSVSRDLFDTKIMGAMMPRPSATHPRPR